MPKINMRSIMGKVRGYEATKKGQARMKEYIDDCLEKGKSSTHGGTLLLSFDDMYESAMSLIYQLQRSAGSYGLPETMVDILDNMDYSGIEIYPYLTDDDWTVYKIDLNFNVSDTDLHRNSLYPDKYDGGVDNIVALLNNGYSAEHFVYGVWRGQPIRSLKNRAGTHFINKTVKDFDESWKLKNKSAHAFLIININDKYVSNDDSVGDGAVY